MRLLQQLAPMLSARLGAGHDAAPLGVRIGPLQGGAVLRARHDGVVLLGTEDAWAQLDTLLLPGAMGQTLRHLFPHQDWVFWRADAF